jgi:hypothetical protein
MFCSDFEQLLLVLIRIFDRVPIMTEDAGQTRVCEYRRCGAPLPPAVGRGSRARFCQDGKTWGRRNLSCRDAEAVLSDAESLRESDTELDDTAVTALADQVDRVLEPAVETLTTLRHQLEATTATALSERDAALAEADDHRRQRGLAEAEAAQAKRTAEEAVAQAEAAEKEKAAALRERDEDRAARRAAMQEQQRAEGQLAAVRDELVRVADHEELARAKAAQETALERARVDADRLRAGFDQRLAELQAAHEQTVRSMHETTTNLGAELRTCTARADAAERELARALAEIQPDDQTLK